VLEPFLLVEWIPGVREAIGLLQEPGASDQIREAFLQSWPAELDQALAHGEGSEKVLQSLRQLLLASAAAAVRAEGRDRDPPPFSIRSDPVEPILEFLRPEEMALAWLGQARALVAWQAVAAEADEWQDRAARRCRWAELGESCGRARQELGEAQRAQSRLRALALSARLSRALDEVSMSLTRCQENFRELAGADLAATERRADLGHEVRALLEQTPAAWPPRALAELQQGLCRLDADRYCGLLARVGPARRPAALWAQWAHFLERELPSVAGPSRARLILLRGMIEAVCDPCSPNSVWERVEEAAGPLGSGQGLEVELIRDPERQPAEWFGLSPDPTLEGPRLGRVGLAVRMAKGTHTCFPRAEWHAPPEAHSKKEEAAPTPQTPEACALVELDALLQAAEAASLAGQAPPPEADEPPTEAAVTFHDLDRERARELDEKWLHWQEKWGPHNFEGLPAGWTFQRPLLWSDLQLEEKDLSLVFRGHIPRGIVFRVKAFGLRRRSGKAIRECAVYVSAGPSPAGFGELYRLVEQPSGAGEEGLRERLRAWPAACLHGALDVVAVRLFVDFWGALGDEMRMQRGDEARRFGEQLSLLLQQELRLETFHPESYQDYPDGWLLLDSDHGAVTGKVRTVIRPGLKDEEGNLRVPALVEVD